MEIDNGGTQIRGGKSASQLFFEVLKAAVDAYPETFLSINFPEDAQQFRKRYVDVLPCFESARLRSPSATDIAGMLANRFAQEVVYKHNDQAPSLDDYLSNNAQSGLPLLELEPNAQPGWQPQWTLNGLERQSLTQVAQALRSQRLISAGAEAAFQGIEDAYGPAPIITLTGRKVVVLGASAEMAPTQQLLAAGADLLWLDLSPPPTHSARGGRLFYPEEGIDLLTQPLAALATISDFAAGDAVDLCLYAYAPGGAREIRLTAVMNALVNALPAAQIASVTLLLSPTTTTPLDPDDLRLLSERYQHRPLWEACLEPIGLLGRGGGIEGDCQAAASRTVVGIQGASYQAAQYLGKLMTAISWHARGQAVRSTGKAFTVSANTAAITQTRSLAHPVFDAAFAGAAALGVLTFTPQQSQTLNGLLAIHDWLNPETAIPGKTRIHGGIHTLPYPLNTALRVAAAIGFARKPSALRGLFKR
jgi:hypothetical protein